MYWARSVFACLTLLLPLTAVRADGPDPLHVIPHGADVVVKIERPRQLVDAVTGSDLFKQLQAFAPIRELYDVGAFKRFFEIVYHFERELGADRYELLDRLAGHGIALGVKAADPGHALLVIRGKDEALLKKFQATGLRVLESELARLDVKESVKKGTHRGVEGVRLGNLFVAVTGTTLLLSNTNQGMQAGIDQLLDRKPGAADNPHVKAARQLLPPDALAWAALNLDVVRASKDFKPLFDLPNDNPAVPILLGGYVDVLRRAPFAAAGLYRRPDGFLATIRLPRGRDGMGAEAALHIPPADQPGMRPLLQPKGTLFSTSYFFDLAKIWDHRARLLNEQQLAVLEGIGQGTSNFPGAPLDKILAMMGPYQRIVVAAQEKPAYKVEPGQRLPAFAFALELRDPKGFHSVLYPAILAGAVGASTQVRLKSVEEKIGEHKLVGYLFPEDGKLPQDATNIRFNFSPCFALVGNQFLIASTLELGRELVATLDKEPKGEAGHAAASQTLLSGAGGAVVLQQLEDQLFVQAMLQRALTPDAARQEVQALLDLLRRAGTLRGEAAFGAKEFRYDVELKFGK